LASNSKEIVKLTKRVKATYQNSPAKIDVSNAALGEGMKEEITHKLK
jgi:hypothetical protein